MKNILLSRLFTHAEPVQRLNNVQNEALQNFMNKLNKNEYSFENVPCLCGNPDGELIGTHDRYGLVVHTHLCDRCGMMWTSPRMTEASLKRFYNEDYRAIYVGSSQVPEDFFYDQVERGRTIFNFISPRITRKSMEPLKVFDVGCGAGGMLLPFKNDGWLSYGCDVGEEYLKRGRDEGLVLEFGGPLSLMQYAPANLVILSHVLEHFPDPLSSLHEISKLVIDDGYLYIEVPGIFNVHSSYGDFLLYFQNAHLYHFTLNTLSTLIASAGFEYVAGNEKISALFKKTKKIKKRSGINESKKILHYIYLVEICRRMYLLRYINTLKRGVGRLLRNHYKERRRH